MPQTATAKSPAALPWASPFPLRNFIENGWEETSILANSSQVVFRILTKANLGSSPNPEGLANRSHNDAPVDYDGLSEFL